MIGPTILAEYRDQFARHAAARPAIPPLKPLPVTVWQAASLMQKSIRRGRTDLALSAAATLMLASPDRLWRRLGTIAFEDIGVADLDMLGLVTVPLGGKRARAILGGEWPVASLLVEIMCASPKCRAADDLLMVVERHPELAKARSRLAELPSISFATSFSAQPYFPSVPLPSGTFSGQTAAHHLTSRAAPASRPLSSISSTSWAHP